MNQTLPIVKTAYPFRKRSIPIAIREEANRARQAQAERRKEYTRVRLSQGANGRQIAKELGLTPAQVSLYKRALKKEGSTCDIPLGEEGASVRNIITHEEEAKKKAEEREKNYFRDLIRMGFDNLKGKVLDPNIDPYKLMLIMRDLIKLDSDPKIDLRKFLGEKSKEEKVEEEREEEDAEMLARAMDPFGVKEEGVRKGESVTPEVE